MDIVDPAHFFRLLDGGDVEVDHDGLLSAAYEHA
jgi:hypothetical protein